MSGKKSVAWSVSVNLGNNESLGLVVTDEVGDKNGARDVFAFGIGQLLGVAKGADEKTARLLQDFVSRFVQEEEANPAVRDGKEPTVRLEAPPAKEPWIPKITKSSREKAQAERAARTLTTAKQDAGPRPTVTLDQVSPLPERATSPTTAEQAAAAVAQCIKPPGAPQPAPSAPPTPEASASAERPAAPPVARTAPAEDACGICGAPVAKAQANLSQLFMGKTLCKTCMDKRLGAS
jgi:hypothetical protein